MQLPVRSSTFTPQWATIPTPDSLTLVRRDGSDPAKPGTYEIAMSLVDDQGRVGPMCDPVTFTAKMPNWLLRIRWHGIEMLTKAVAVCLWHRRVDIDTTEDAAWYEMAPYNGNKDETVTPFLPLSGWDSHSKRCVHIKRADRRYPQMTWKPYAQWDKSTTLAAPPQPTVELLHTPNKVTGVSFAWVGNDGESLPSPVLTVQPLPGFDNANSSPIYVARTPYLPPNGALGMHVYLLIDGFWHRQPAPHVSAVTPFDYTPDEWLWPLAMQQFTIERVEETLIPPATTAGRSWLSSRNRAVYESQASIIIDSDDPICCPIISPHKDRQDRFYDLRTIAGESQQQWYLISAESTPDGVSGYAMGWPRWLETAQRTRLVGCYIKQPWTGTPRDGVGIDMLSYMGSSCFHFRPERTFIVMEGGGHTVGIRCLGEAKGLDDHSASEPLWFDTEINASFPLVVEGNQSANWQLHYSTLISVGQYAEHCIITQSNSGNLSLTGRLTSDGGRTLLAVMEARQTIIEKWFSDQGHPCWVVYGSYGKTRVELECAGTNHQGINKSFLHLAEAPRVGRNQNDLVITGNSGNFGWSVPNPQDQWWVTRTDIQVTVFSPRYAGVVYNMAPMPLFALFTPPLPGIAQWRLMTFNNAYGLQSYFAAWDNSIDVVSVQPLHKVL